MPLFRQNIIQTQKALKIIIFSMIPLLLHGIATILLMIYSNTNRVDL